jgi:bifunctional DNA-binding transcriptional regulator/antitoxin component of YhaV-PrlF toxin-antitoxin module
MSRESRPPRSRTDRERLVGVLVPGPIGRPPPSPPPLPALPSLRLPTDAGPDAALLDLARLDRSGRVYARPLLDALGWSAGHRVDIAVVAGVLVVGSKPGGLHVVGSRGVLTLPAAARSMCGIEPGLPVVLLASPAQNTLVVHPASTVTRLLAQHHTRLEGDRDDC